MHIPFINIADCNFWIVQLIPFEHNEREDHSIWAFQKYCLNKKIFGMGWTIDEPIKTFSAKDVELNESNSKTYKDKREIAGLSVPPQRTLSNYAKIQKGDYVVMRLKNGHFYIGKVNRKAHYFYSEEEKYNRLSWYCVVEEWQEFATEDEMPMGICGRLAQRRQSAISRVLPYHLKLLLLLAYESKIPESLRVYHVPPISLTVNRFAESLNYKELEDLVCCYINEKHKDSGYFMVPSSGKVNQQNYEFTFVNLQGEGKPITCQVKNKKSIALDQYKEETAYERIYLFSGCWSQEEIDAVNREKSHLYAISPQELFEVFCKYAYFKNKRKVGYSIAQEDGGKVLFSKENRRRIEEVANPLLGKKKVKFWDDESFIEFGSSGFFYTREFHALVQSYGNCSQEITDKIQSILKEIAQ